MIGFVPPKNDNYKSLDSNKNPDEKEEPVTAPGREIGEPRPSFIPAPEPDRYTNSPAPELTPIPPENPPPNIVPEILPPSPQEINWKYL